MLALSEGTTEILLIAPKLLGESLAVQFTSRSTSLKIRLNKENLTKHPSLIIWFLENIELANSIQIELRKLEEYWNPSPLLLIIPEKISLSTDDLLNLGCRGLLQDPDFETLLETISTIKDGGRVVKIKENKSAIKTTNQTLGLGQWLLISGLQQINNEICSIEDLININQQGIITDIFLKGRKRELNTAKSFLVLIWGPLASKVEPKNNNSILTTKQKKGIIDIGTNLNLKKNDSESIWQLINNQLAIAIDNSINKHSENLLSIYALKSSKKKELLRSLHIQLNKVIQKLQKNDPTQKDLNTTWETLQEDIRKEALRNMSGEYIRVNFKGNPINLMEKLIEISNFSYEDEEIPDPKIMLDTLLKNKPININGQLLPPDDPRAIIHLELLFSNWLIRNSEIISSEIISACALWPEIRNYFLTRDLISTRELERLRNQINNRNRWASFIERPIQLYESKRLLYKFSANGIQSVVITELRDEELRNLGWWQQQIALVVETRDALAPQAQALVKKIGSLMVILLTQVLGRSLGLIGRGIAQGMGRTLGGS